MIFSKIFSFIIVFAVYFSNASWSLQGNFKFCHQIKCMFAISQYGGLNCQFFNYHSANKICKLDFCSFDSNYDGTHIYFSSGQTSHGGWNSYVPTVKDAFDPATMTFKGMESMSVISTEILPGTTKATTPPTTTPATNAAPAPAAFTI